MDEEQRDHECDEAWLWGVDEDDPERQCPNCGEAVQVEQLAPPATTGGLLLCPECQAELPWGAIEDVPVTDWFNWAKLTREAYEERPCFSEPFQRALSLWLSAADPRGADVSLEITRDRRGDILVKVVNSESLTYFPYAGTSIEGSYTVVRFSSRR